MQAWCTLGLWHEGVTSQRWIGATTAAVTVTTVAGDRTPGIGGKAGAAGATISTAAAMMAGPVVHAPALTMAAAAMRLRE